MLLSSQKVLVSSSGRRTDELRIDHTRSGCLTGITDASGAVIIFFEGAVQVGEICALAASSCAFFVRLPTTPTKPSHRCAVTWNTQTPDLP